MTNEDTWEALVGFSDSRYGLAGTCVDFLAKQDIEECYMIKREGSIVDHCNVLFITFEPQIMINEIQQDL